MRREETRRRMRKRNNIAEALQDYHIKTNVPPGARGRLVGGRGGGREADRGEICYWNCAARHVSARADLISFLRRTRDAPGGTG